MMIIIISCTFPGQKPRCETCSQDQDHRIISSVQDLDENGAYADCFSYNRCLTTMMLFGIDSNDYIIRTWESPFFEIALTWRRSEGVSRTYIPLSVWYGNVSVIVVVLVFLGYFLQSKAEETGKDKSGAPESENQTRKRHDRDAPVSLLVDMHMCLHVQTLPTPLLSCLSDGQIKSGSKLLSEKLVEELVHTIEGIRDNLDLGN